MNDKNINLKPISLKVKDKTPKQKETKEYHNESVFLILLSIALILTTVFLISVVLNTDKTPEIFEKITDVPTLDGSNNLYNKWLTDNNSLFIFGSDLKFAWYDDSTNLENNYYLGTYTFKTNNEALIEMGYNQDEFRLNFPNISNLDNVYSVTIKPTYLYRNHLNVTNTQLQENENWWFIIMIDDEGNTVAYNKTLDQRYNLKVEQ